MNSAARNKKTQGKLDPLSNKNYKKIVRSPVNLDREENWDKTQREKSK